MIDVNEAMKAAAAKMVIDIAMAVLKPTPEVAEAIERLRSIAGPRVQVDLINMPAGCGGDLLTLARAYLTLTAPAAPEKSAGEKGAGRG